jgi:hypothetical protein
LGIFGKATGMFINERKSTLSLHNMSLIETDFYRKAFPYAQQEFNLGLKYLGFQSKTNNYKKED